MWGPTVNYSYLSEAKKGWFAVMYMYVSFVAWRKYLLPQGHFAGEPFSARKGMEGLMPNISAQVSHP